MKSLPSGYHVGLSHYLLSTDSTNRLDSWDVMVIENCDFGMIVICFTVRRSLSGWRPTLHREGGLEPSSYRECGASG
jgi:hypothetical protein